MTKKSANICFFSSKANMFIKHFNIHQKIPLHIIQEFFLNESRMYMGKLFTIQSLRVKSKMTNTVKTNKITAQ